MVGMVVQICWHCFVVIKPAEMLIVRGGGGIKPPKSFNQSSHG